MIIALMSDSHDHIWNIRKALEIIRNRGGEAIIHCGDFVAPFMLKELDQAEIPVHGVFGNNDGDKFLLTKFSLTTLTNITLHGIVGRLEFSGFRIAFTHYEEVAEGLAATRQYDLVCFGHSHQTYLERVENTVLLNPGEIMGKDGSPGFYILDTSEMKYEHVSL
nr:metallophosphoesterase [Desulfobacterales bacterium]